MTNSEIQISGSASYKVAPFPRLRQFVIDSARFAHNKHIISCFVEVDVTNGRRQMREYKNKTGSPLSFTAYMIGCLARAVSADRALHAYRDWRNQLIIFDDVDVITHVEIEMDEAKFPINHIVRAADKKSIQEIQNEIYAVKANPMQSPSGKMQRAAKFFLMLPYFVRSIVYRIINLNPHAWKRYVGTVSLSSVGMFGARGGWGMRFSAHTLSVTVGGISEKPAVINGKIGPREILDLTVDFDHDIVDGAPAARFMKRFRELLESESVIAQETEGAVRFADESMQLSAGQPAC